MSIEIVRNDITKMNVDAIVNAANMSLLGGSGVDGAIHRAAGLKLLEECRTLRGCKTGEAKITRGYDLPAKYVIHTVGPVWKGGKHHEAELLSSCYLNSLILAKEYKCETVAFPMISTGVYGYPKAQALQVAMDTITRFLLENDLTVYLVVFTRDAFEISSKLFKDISAFIDDVYVDEHLNERSETLRKRQLICGYRRSSSDSDSSCSPSALMSDSLSLADILSRVDESFSQMLLRKIDAKGITDAECYKKANIDRRLFNKIKNDPDYRPGKQTVLAFALALELSLDETKELLSKAGFALSRSNKVDIVVEYFINERDYDITTINQVLFKFDLPLLGY